MSINLLTHGIAILELEPQEPNGYICTDDANPDGYPCSPEDFCDIDSITYEVNFDASDENIYNWYTRLGLVCKPHGATAKIGISCMVGIFLGVLIIPRLGDLIGRKPVFWTSLWVSIAPLVVVAFTSSLLVIDIAAFLAGPCIIARMSCGFLMLMEHMPRKHQAKVGAVIMVSEGLCQVLWVFYLSVISKDTFKFIYFAVALNVISAIGTYWIPESPRYLYGINDLEKCREVFTYLARCNGVADYQPPSFDVDFEIMVENLDGDSNSRPTERKTHGSEGGGNFDSLLSKRDRNTASSPNKKDDAEEGGNDRKTTTMGRYMTVSKAANLNIREETSINRLTKRETVAYMHATVTGIRKTGSVWVIGADRTQSIALDEIFSKKPVYDGVERSTMALRNTKSNLRDTGIAGNSDEEDDIIEVPTSVMRGNGLCQGRTGVNLFLMVILWVTSCVSYGMINIYMKYIPGTIYLNFTIAGLSEIMAHITVGVFYIKLTPRWTFFLGYSIAAVGGIFLIF